MTKNDLPPHKAEVHNLPPEQTYANVVGLLLHEITHPIMGALWAVRHLRERQLDIDKSRKVLEDAELHCRAALEVVDRCRSWYQFESKHFELRLESIQAKALRDVIGETSCTLSAPSTRRGVAIDIGGTNISRRWMVTVDLALIKLALFNMLDFLIVHSERSSRVRVTVQMRTAPGDHSHTDPAVEMQMVLSGRHAFSKLDMDDGWGPIGALSIVKKILAMHGAQFEIVSDPGSTTFRLLLPASLPSNNAVHTATPNAARR